MAEGCARPWCEVTAPSGAGDQVGNRENLADCVGGRGGGAEGSFTESQVHILEIPTCA